MKLNYQVMRQDAKTGDVLLLEGRSIISKIIRVVTGEKISHVGMLIWLDKGLFVAEFKEFKGFQIVRASHWVEDAFTDGNNAYYGQAPDMVTRNPKNIHEHVFDFRRKKYGYFSLIKIWFSQLFRVNLKIRRLVCSTFIQMMWQEQGYEFERNADPGDYIELCDSVKRIKSML